MDNKVQFVSRKLILKEKKNQFSDFFFKKYKRPLGYAEEKVVDIAYANGKSYAYCQKALYRQATVPRGLR
jgi:hypothetical protein